MSWVIRPLPIQRNGVRRGGFLYLFLWLGIPSGPMIFCLFVDLSRSHSDTSHSVGLPLTNARRVARTYTWHHTTLTTDRQTCSPPAGFESALPANERFRPRDHRDRLSLPLPLPILSVYVLVVSNVYSVCRPPYCSWWLRSWETLDKDSNYKYDRVSVYCVLRSDTVSSVSQAMTFSTNVFHEEE
jgi:hypothetical protein